MLEVMAAALGVFIGFAISMPMAARYYFPGEPPLAKSWEVLCWVLRGMR